MNIVELALYKEDEANPTKAVWEVTLLGGDKLVGHFENLYNDQFKVDTGRKIYFSADKVLCVSRY